MFCRSARSRLLFAVLGLTLALAGCSAERPRLDDDAAASREVVADESTTTTAPAAATRTLRLAVGADWTGDPADAGPASVATRVIAGLLHEGLTSIGADGSAEPGLAERWFVSDDRLQWTFVLPDELTDGDDAAVTARDVKASFERLRDRGPYDQLVVSLSVIDGWERFVAGDVGGAAGIVALNDTTVVITLAAPYEPLGELLAAPGYGITGENPDGSMRTTGAYRTTDDPSWLAAVDPEAVVDRIELVRSDGNGAELLAARRVDWAVLADGTGTSDLVGDVLRQPLDLRVGLAVRFDDAAARRALVGALDPAFLAAAVPNGIVDVSGSVEPDAASLPGSVVIHVPSGELEPLVAEASAQLTNAGVDVSLVVLEPADFADAVAAGEATVFPMIAAGGAWSQSAGVALAEPAGVDDVFGVTAAQRSELVAAINAEPESAARASLVNALEQMLLDDGLLLPVAYFEVQVGVGDDMDALRIAPDGTLDLGLLAG